MNKFCAKKFLRNLSGGKGEVLMCSGVRAHYYYFASPNVRFFRKGNGLSGHTRRIRQIMAKKSSAKNSTTQLADDVLFGARVLYRELDDIFGHVSGRLPREVNREGLGCPGPLSRKHE